MCSKKEEARGSVFFLVMAVNTCTHTHHTHTTHTNTHTHRHKYRSDLETIKFFVSYATISTIFDIKSRARFLKYNLYSLQG